ncbi:MAG: hypothetical protein ACPGYV_03415 [Phycisphaeraceae bacterium]
MKPLTRLLALLLTLCVASAWSAPAAAGRLAEVSGESNGSEIRDEAEFKLSDHSQVEIDFNIRENGKDCAVKVRVHRKQQNGQWLLVNTTLRTSKTTSGSRSVTLPAGDYKIEVISTSAKYNVAVDL